MPDDVIAVGELGTLTVNNYVYNLKDQLQRVVYARGEAAFADGDAVRDGIRTPAALRRRQRMVRAALRDCIGGLPSLDTPLNIKVTGRIAGKGFDIENLIYESRPKTYVTANLYVPHGITRPRGAVLLLCGHDPEGKQAYPAVCLPLVQAGLVVLAQDPIGQGERLSYYEPALGGATVGCGTAEHDHAGAQCLPLGDALARYFLHDSLRSVDVLCARPEVDPRRIGVTGYSGGGMQTSLMMMADPRIAAAAPGLFITNRRAYMYGGGAQDAEQVWPGATVKGIDHEDYLLGMCPKPVCVLAARYDFFPIEGTRETIARCRRLWRMSGHAANLELVEDRSIHRCTPKMIAASARFFSKHLLGREEGVRSAVIPTIEPSRLLCTKSGQVRGDFPQARAVYDENKDRLMALERRRRSLPEARRRKRAVAWLKGRIGSGRARVPANLRCYGRIKRSGDMLVDQGMWWSQKGILNEGLLFRHFRYDGKALPVTVAVWDEGTRALARHWDWIRATCAAGRAVLVLNVSGVGGGEPNALNAHLPQAPYGAIHKFNDDLVWLDDSLCALRAWDVTRVLAALAEWPGVDRRDVRVYAHGKQGVYAELAAAIEPRLARMEVHEPIPGFADWVRARLYEQAGCRAFVFPGILAYCDLPDLRRWREG